MLSENVQCHSLPVGHGKNMVALLSEKSNFTHCLGQVCWHCFSEEWENITYFLFVIRRVVKSLLFRAISPTCC